MRKVAEIMTKRPATVTAEDTLDTLLKILVRNRISGCPVVDRKMNVVGVVAQSDVLRLIDVFGKVNAGPEFVPMISSFIKSRTLDVKKLRSVKVGDFCNRRAITIDRYASVYDAARKMNKHNIERLPVVDGKKLVGIVTRTDVVKAIEAYGKL